VSAYLVLQVVALACYALAAIAPRGGELPARVNLVALGLFCSLLGVLIGR
jgi:hypothetical protein